MALPLHMHVSKKQFLMAVLTRSLCQFSVVLRITVVALVSAVLAGCAGLGRPVVDSASASDAVSPQPKAAELPPASFEPDTIYDLLVAEVAGYNQRYDITLGNYLQQAHKTRDAGVAERAYQVASFINARQAAADAASLWQQVDAENPLAMRAHGVEQAWSGELLQAFDQLAKVQAAGEDAPFAFVAMQAAERDDELRDQLLARFNNLLRSYPQEESLQIGRAMLLHQSGDNVAALAEIERVLQLHGDDPQVLLLKARLLVEQERVAEAHKLLVRAVRDFPQSPRLRLLYARLLVKQGDLTGAQKQFEVLARQHPRNPDLLLSVALVAMENGMPGEAGLYLHRLGKLEGRADIAHYYLGQLAEQMDDWDEGRKYFLKVAPGPQFIPAWSALVRMLSDHEQWQLARKDLHDARKKYPDYGPQLFLMEGEVLQEKLGYDEAFKVYNQAVAEYPDDSSLLYVRAMLAEKLDDLTQLEQDLRRILSREPNHTAALNALGYTLADRTERYQEAAQLIRKAYALNAEDASIIDSMGWVEYRLGNYDKALKYLREAYRAFDDAEVAAHLGEVLWVKGRRQEAQTIWNQGLEKDPDSAILKTTIERLQGADSK